MRVRTTTELGALVRGARAERHMSQQALASAIGVSRRWVTNLETGVGNPTIELLLRCFDVLGLGLSADPVAGYPQLVETSLDRIISRSQGAAGR